MIPPWCLWLPVIAFDKAVFNWPLHTLVIYHFNRFMVGISALILSLISATVDTWVYFMQKAQMHTVLICILSMHQLMANNLMFDFYLQDWLKYIWLRAMPVSHYIETIVLIDTHTHSICVRADGEQCWISISIYGNNWSLYACTFLFIEWWYHALWFASDDIIRLIWFSLA